MLALQLEMCLGIALHNFVNMSLLISLGNCPVFQSCIYPSIDPWMYVLIAVAKLWHFPFRGTWPVRAFSQINFLRSVKTYLRRLVELLSNTLSCWRCHYFDVPPFAKAFVRVLLIPALKSSPKATFERALRASTPETNSIIDKTRQA